MEHGRAPKKMSEIVWAVYNWGIIQTIAHRRKDAVKYAILNSPENDWQRYFEVRKIRVVPLT